MPNPAGITVRRLGGGSLQREANNRGEEGVGAQGGGVSLSGGGGLKEFEFFNFKGNVSPGLQLEIRPLYTSNMDSGKIGILTFSTPTSPFVFVKCNGAAIHVHPVN